MPVMNSGSEVMVFVPSAAATLQIPGDGKGSGLSIVTTLNTVAPAGTAITKNTIITLNSTAGLALGQLIITTDGMWGTIIGFAATGTAPGGNNVEVDQWRGAGGSDNKIKPAAPVANAVRVFPAGSVLASCRAVRIHHIGVIKAPAGTALAFFDFGTSALFTHIDSMDLPLYGWRLPSPFMVTSSVTLSFCIVFEIVA